MTARAASAAQLGRSAKTMDAAAAAAGGAATIASRAVAKAEAPPPPPADPLDPLARWVVTEDHVKEMVETELIWRDAMARSHLAVWCAPPNGGKTSLAMFAASELAQDNKVLYFQEDAGSGDIPQLWRHARDSGYQLLSSAMTGSTEDQIAGLRRMVKLGVRLDGVVMFFDTLKKYTDLMSKGGSRAFFKLMRSLTLLGATVILLGHTNKHKGVDGKLMFEGVGDVRSDVDELIYLDAAPKDPLGMVTVTMRPDKVRSAVKERTFELDTRARTVRALDRVVNVAAILERERQLEEDRLLIDAISAALAKGGMKHTELRDAVVKATGEGKTAVTRVIERYLSEDVEDPHALWIETRMRLNNVRYISRKPRRA